MWVLVTLEGEKIVPSIYAKEANDAGLQIITWTLERSGLLMDGGGYYYQARIASLLVPAFSPGSATGIDVTRFDFGP